MTNLSIQESIAAKREQLKAIQAQKLQERKAKLALAKPKVDPEVLEAKKAAKTKAYQERQERMAAMQEQKVERAKAKELKAKEKEQRRTEKERQKAEAESQKVEQYNKKLKAEYKTKIQKLESKIKSRIKLMDRIEKENVKKEKSLEAKKAGLIKLQNKEVSKPKVNTKTQIEKTQNLLDKTELKIAALMEKAELLRSRLDGKMIEQDTDKPNTDKQKVRIETRTKFIETLTRGNKKRENHLNKLRETQVEDLKKIDDMKKALVKLGS